MGTTFAWVFIGFVALVFVGMLYDNLKCKHEWKEHYFEKGGASIVCLICKKCGKVKVLK
jgi:hypothetical protein